MSGHAGHVRAGIARREPQVQCCHCGVLFEHSGVRPGDRVDCPMCQAEVEVGELSVWKRHYRARSPKGTPRGHGAAPTRDEIGATGLRILVGLAIVVAVAALVYWQQDILNEVGRIAREHFGRGKPR